MRRSALVVGLATWLSAGAGLSVATAQAQGGQGTGASAGEPATAPPTPSSRDLAEARGHFQAGAAAFRAGRYEEAAEEFQQAYTLTRSADVLFNLATCYDRLDRRPEAVHEYQRYLQLEPQATDRDRVGHRIHELQVMMAAVDQAGAPGGQGSGAQAPGQDDGAAGGNAGHTTPTGHRSSMWRIATYATYGLAGAALIGAVVTGIVSASIHAGLVQSCDENRVCPADKASDIDTGRTLAGVSTALTIVTIVAAAGGTALLLFAPRTREQAPAPAHAGHVALGPGPGLVGASARVTF